MARRKSVPSYCLHKPSGQAVVYVDRKPVYLGEFESEASRRAYGELLSGRASTDLRQTANPTASPTVLVSDLCVRFRTEELPRFSRAERYCQVTTIRLLCQIFGRLPVTEFGPLRLRVVRDAMVEGDLQAKDDEGKPSPRKPWSRDTVNRQVKRIQALFRWGVSWEMVPETVAAALSTVRILGAGETAAGESMPRRAVSDEDFAAVKAELKPYYQDILQLMSLTGARPGELLNLRMKDIERKGEVWRADLKKHKTAHKGKRRVLYFNRSAQAILLRYLSADPESQIFPRRRDNFSTAVRRACKRAGVTPFVPHEIRHTTATRLVDEVGIEAAQRLLGHSDAAMTEHYSRTAEKQAIDAVKRLG